MISTGEKRLVVIGHPGTGKTTFVKHVVYKWAAATESNKKDMMLQQFVFVIPIILRLVRPGSTLSNILEQQLPLTKLDICVIQHALKQQSSLLMFLLDGYDEITCQGIIQQVIRKEEFPNATVIITTRPHGLPLIHQLGDGAVQLLVEIIGFNKKQIQNYIEKFMLANDEKDGKTHNQLFTNLSTNDKLLKMATCPTQLEIMCFVWLTHKDLGQNLSDLYKIFLISLLKHMERKKHSPLPEDKSDAKLLQIYDPLLMDISRMANTWDENGHLQAIFSNKELEEHLGVQLKKAKELGFIVKYNPSKDEKTSDWSFTHLTLQYYFIANFLSRSTKEEDGNEFAKCHSLNDHMDTIWGIMQFLYSMEAEIADTILQTYTKITHGKNECLILQKFLCQLVKEHRSKIDTNIPLPECVQWTPEQDIEALKILSKRDKAKHHRNMKYLEVKRLTNRIKDFDISYVPNVSMTVRHEGEVRIMANCIKKASKLRKLNLFLPRKDVAEAEIEMLLANTPKEVTELCIAGYNIIKPVSKMLSGFQSVNKVHLKDKTENTVEVESCFTKNISSFAKADISIEQELLDLSLLTTTYQGTLKIHFFCSRKNELDKLKMKVMKMENDLVSNIKCLNLSGTITRQNDLSSHGDAIGMVLVKVLNLETLEVDFCKLNSNSLVQMARIMAKENKSLALTCLTMNGNNLKEGGAELVQILHYTPNITDLELGDSQLDDTVFDVIAKENSLTPKLRMLNVSGNVLEKSTSTGLHDMLNNKPQLNALSMGWCNIDASITDSIFSDTPFQSLEQLDLRYNHLGDGLHSVACHLSLMPSLKILNLSFCGCSDTEELVNLCKNIPASLEELDVRGNPFDKDVVMVSYAYSEGCNTGNIFYVYCYSMCHCFRCTVRCKPL